MDDSPLDLQKMDFEGNRLKLRRKLLIYSLIPIVLVALVALKCLSVAVLSNMSMNQYKAKSFESSLATQNPLGLLNLVQAYIYDNNRGLALVNLGRFTEAQDAFNKALERAPKDKLCAIRVNLVAAYELEADKKYNDKAYDAAITLYDKAKAAIDGAPKDCFDKSNSSKESLEGAKKRVEEKSDQAKKARNGEGSESEDKNSETNDSKGQNDSSDISEEQQKQLDQQRQKSQQKRRESSQRNRIDYEKNTGEYDRKVW